MQGMDNSAKGIDKRIKWVDLTKCVACLIVLTGHLLQGLVKAGIMQDSFGYGYANRMMYHVNIALFLICSGYLYQKYCHIDSFKEYLKNLGNKAFRLLVPYVFFVTLSWGIKYFLRDEVNTQVDSLFHELVIKPMSPYWFLLTLFALFVITPLIKGWRTLLLVNIEAVTIYLMIVSIHGVPYVVTLLTVVIWFVLGMDLAYLKVDECVCGTEMRSHQVCRMIVSVLLIIAFLFSGFIEYKKDIHLDVVYFLISMLGCCGIICLDILICKMDDCLLLAKMSNYVMPVYLMHTIFSAGVRIILTKLEISSLPIHLLLGYISAIAGPIIVYEVWGKIYRKREGYYL